MKSVRALPSATMRPFNSLLELSRGAIERLKHLLIAGVIAGVLLLAVLLDPFDQLGWALQSRLVEHQPSGDIIFVGTDRGLTDGDLPHRRKELARALEELDRQGVGRVFLDIAIAEPSTAEADDKLASAIENLGARAALVDQITTVGSASEQLVVTLPEIGGDTKRVATRRSVNWLGYVWTREFSQDIGGRRIASLGAALAGISPERVGSYQIDYAIDFEDIPTLSLDEINSGRKANLIAGRTIVIGETADPNESQQRIPGRFSVPYSYIAIYGGETLKSGRTGFLGPLPTLIITILILTAIILATNTAKRRVFAYGGLILALCGGGYAAAILGIRTAPSYGIVLLVAYAVMRSRARWKGRLALQDQETGLPRIRALEQAIADDLHARGHIVVARIHGYEHVLKTLPRFQRTAYILKLVDRLRATDSELSVYFDSHHLAWHSGEDDSARLSEHLEGLRAMFAAPVNVNGSSIDVGISFGVARLDGDPASRLGAAIAAAEESSEALQPIKFAESGSRFDELWDISLRARIDEAMTAGEIFCVYQPKVDTRSNIMTGVEALVRWEDPARGFIPPMHFIAQCEKAGRMEALTEYIFQHALSAGRLLHFHGRSLTMSVNISATLLADMRIVGMVRKALESTGFDPRFLILEVTETSRIGNLESARIVLNELRSLGTRISMDDFGVGETNFETLFELPFDEVKVDRLFVGSIAKSTKAKAIVTSIVNMGRETGIGIVAEGAEDLETLRILTFIGCTHVQGYILAKPMSLENIMEFNDLPHSGLISYN